jgi:WD40 repeat protein
VRAACVEIRRALGRELQFLARRPDLLRQQLANRLQWAPAEVTEALAEQLEAATGGPRLRPRTEFREADALVRTMSLEFGSVLCCAVSPDGALVAAGDHGGDVWLWSVTGQLAGKLTGHTDAVNCCAFSPDGSWVVSAGSDETLRLWDPQTRRGLATLRGHEGPVLGCAVSPNGAFVVSAGADRALRLWDPRGRESIATLRAHGAAVYGCAVSPDGTFIASASADHTLKLWDSSTRDQIATLVGHEDAVYACAVSPDAAFVVSASADKTVKLWDRGGRCLATLTGHIDAVRGCAVTPDAAEVVSASADTTVKVWARARPAGEPVTPPALEPVELPSGNPFVQPWLADLARESHESKAIGAADGSRATLEGHALPVFDCDLTPDGGLIVSAGVDRTVKLWSTDVAVAA